MEFSAIMVLNLAVVTGIMLVGWLVSLLVKKVTFVDSIWGTGFVIVAWITFLLTERSVLHKPVGWD